MSGALAVAALVACAVATLPAGLRWIRVAQREHYLPGAATRFAGRWWGSGPARTALIVVGAAGAAAGVVVPAAGIVAALVAGTGPPGLSVRGRTSKLRWTRRCATVGALVVLVTAAAMSLGAVLGGVRGAAVASALAAVGMPVVVDGVLAVLRPVEDRLSRRFVAEAAARVARVRPRIVGITGSYGKTSTKVYAAHLASGRFSVAASPRSFNNRAGLARTVNELLVPGTDVLVAEMGAYGPGEIASLCSWLPPRVAAITAIGPVHLERFRTLERTLAAKSEIAAGAEVVVLNTDDVALAGLAERLEREGRSVVRCSGSDSGADVAVLETEGRLALHHEGRLVGSAPAGPEGLPPARTNVAVAAAVAMALGCTGEEVLARLPSLPAVSNRLAAVRGSNGAVVLDDTFNSNPAGAALALEELRRRSSPGGRRVVVTPGMVELGGAQATENAALARAAAAVATDVVVVGRTNRRALATGLAAADAEGRHVSVRYVARRDEAVALVRAMLGPDDVVLYENDLPDHYP
ncbi:MAG: Mur ligase family protein [Actinomycetota bacterium]|nr:Mur ligase family protein [Actinomycetota bacterium]